MKKAHGSRVSEEGRLKRHPLSRDFVERPPTLSRMGELLLEKHIQQRMMPKLKAEEDVKVYSLQETHDRLMERLGVQSKGSSNEATEEYPEPPALEEVEMYEPKAFYDEFLGKIGEELGAENDVEVIESIRQMRHGWDAIRLEACEYCRVKREMAPPHVHPASIICHFCTEAAAKRSSTTNITEYGPKRKVPKIEVIVEVHRDPSDDESSETHHADVKDDEEFPPYHYLQHQRPSDAAQSNNLPNSTSADTRNSGSSLAREQRTRDLTSHEDSPPKLYPSGLSPPLQMQTSPPTLHKSTVVSSPVNITKLCMQSGNAGPPVTVHHIKVSSNPTTQVYDLSGTRQSSNINTVHSTVSGNFRPSGTYSNTGHSSEGQGGHALNLSQKHSNTDPSDGAVIEQRQVGSSDALNLATSTNKANLSNPLNLSRQMGGTAALQQYVTNTVTSFPSVSSNTARTQFDRMISKQTAQEREKKDEQILMRSSAIRTGNQVQSIARGTPLVQTSPAAQTNAHQTTMIKARIQQHIAASKASTLPAMGTYANSGNYQDSNCQEQFTNVIGVQQQQQVLPQNTKQTIQTSLSGSNSASEQPKNEFRVAGTILHPQPLANNKMMEMNKPQEATTSTVHMSAPLPSKLAQAMMSMPLEGATTRVSKVAHSVIATPLVGAMSKVPIAVTTPAPPQPITIPPSNTTAGQTSPDTKQVVGKTQPTHQPLVLLMQQPNGTVLVQQLPQTAARTSPTIPTTTGQAPGLPTHSVLQQNFAQKLAGGGTTVQKFISIPTTSPSLSQSTKNTTRCHITTILSDGICRSQSSESAEQASYSSGR